MRTAMNKTQQSNPIRQRGLSLIELMIAISLGLLIIGAILGVFITTNRNFLEDERYARMQENGRYAMRLLVEDLSMVGFWGAMLDTPDIITSIRDCTSDNTGPCSQSIASGSTLLELDAKCGEGTTGLTDADKWPYAVSLPSMEVIKTATSGTYVHDKFECIPSSEFQPNTDVLTIKRMQGREIVAGTLSSDYNAQIYMRTNGKSGMLFSYDSALTPGLSDSTDWAYISRIYYIKNFYQDTDDGIPTLQRKTLRYDDPTPDDGNTDTPELRYIDEPGFGVAPGIEYFHVLFGIDTDTNPDGIPNIYVSEPTAAQMAAAVTARIFVLARSVNSDGNYTNNKVYTLGDVVKDYSGSPDNYYRRVFSTTVSLRNNINRLLLNR